MASYIFRIDEIRENENLPPAAAHQSIAEWIPTIPSVRVQEGASYSYWYCDGQQIIRVSEIPGDVELYSTFSMFYRGGRGYWVLRGDATMQQSPETWDTWQPLCFNHEGYSSSATNAGQHTTVRYSRPDQRWADMLLPNIYHGKLTHNPHKGALTGDLAIFLGLLAFSMRPEHMPSLLPQMMASSRFAEHPYTHGRDDKRGVVVYVYLCPSWNPRSSRADLWALERGARGACYYH